MKRRNKNVKSDTDEDIDEDDRLLFETAKQNDKSHKCGTYRQKKIFSEEK